MTTPDPRPDTPREVAITRLATMVREHTPERRWNHAEWVIDAILDAVRAEVGSVS